MTTRNRLSSYAKKVTKETALSLMDEVTRRCEVCPDCGERWSWTGNHKHNMAQAVIERAGVRYTVRRLVWVAFQARPFTGRILTTDCGNPSCLNPELALCLTRGQMLRALQAKGLINNQANKIAKTRARRARGTKLSMDIANEIRANADVPGVDYAQKFGVKPQMISAIRSNKVYKPSNPFAGLMR